MTYVQPLLLVLLALELAGLVIVRQPKGRYLALAGVLGLVLISWPPVDWLLAQPLQATYPVRPFVAPRDLQAIVVLGSSVEPPHYERPYPLPNIETFERCQHAAWIFKQQKQLPILACEGRARGPRIRNVMRDLLVRAGVRDDMIWTEDQSQSTHENAVYGARILRAHGIRRIALVVDTQSMPRAEACFRKEGLAVTPAPVELRSWGPLIDEIFPNWHSIRRNEILLHEMVGLVWYRLRGWA